MKVFREEEEYDRLKKPLDAALEKAAFEKHEIHEIVLMGGSSRLPYVRNWLAEYFEKDVSELENRVSEDEGVAIGATMMAAVLTGQKPNLIVSDVVPLSLGIEKLLNRMEVMINSNATIPFEATKVFKTNRDDQEMLEFVVRQGNSKRARENDLVGKFTLNEIPKGPKGQEIEVTMKCDVNSLFFCTATVKNSEGVTAQLST